MQFEALQNLANKVEGWVQRINHIGTGRDLLCFSTSYQNSFGMSRLRPAVMRSLLCAAQHGARQQTNYEGTKWSHLRNLNSWHQEYVVRIFETWGFLKLERGFNNSSDINFSLLQHLTGELLLRGLAYLRITDAFGTKGEIQWDIGTNFTAQWNLKSGIPFPKAQRGWSPLQIAA